jgi:hypothetical protein
MIPWQVSHPLPSSGPEYVFHARTMRQVFAPQGTKVIEGDVVKVPLIRTGAAAFVGVAAKRVRRKGNRSRGRIRAFLIA